MALTTVSKVCTALAGVDFSSDESFVSDKRSPLLLNMYKDYNQTFNTAIETRPGFRLERAFEDGITKAFVSKNIEGYLFVHSNGNIYLYVEGYEKLHLTACEKTPFFVDFFGKIYAYASSEVFCFEIEETSEGDEATDRSEEEGFVSTSTIGENIYLHTFDEMERAFVPLTYLTARDGTLTEYQGVNLLTGKQRNYFQLDGSTKSLTLIPYAPEDTVEILEVTVNGTATTAYSVSSNIVTLNSAPADLSEVEVKFYQEVDNAIANCDVFYCFDERMFAGGYGDGYFWSGLKDPSYFPVLAYEGIDNGPVKGFFQATSNLLVSVNNQTYICSTVLTDVETLPKTYPNYAITNTYGSGVCGDFLNDPVVLTQYGLMGITSVDYYGERNLFSRSTLVNGRLTNEVGIENASMAMYREYLMILLNGNIYLANSRESFDTDDDFEYEWYYWTDIGAEEDGIFFPATQILPTADKLMFVTENGYVGIFNTDLVKSEESGELLSIAYADDISSVFDGEVTMSKKAIFSCYVTSLDDFGYRSYRKNSRKVGNICDLKAFSHTKCKIKTRSSQTPFTDVGSYNGDYIDFVDTDFASFTFSTSDIASFFFKPAQKKFQKSQLMLYSDELYKPFGVLGIYQEIEVLGYAK
ncbi:MAG: hypothetical protein R3Y65_00290 [Bacillota bacterium]